MIEGISLGLFFNLQGIPWDKPTKNPKGGPSLGNYLHSYLYLTHMCYGTSSTYLDSELINEYHYHFTL